MTTEVPRADQLSESDFNFITRLAKQYDCTAKVADGMLLVLPGQAGQSASGKLLGAVTLTRIDVSRWQFRLADRSAHKAVITNHQDPNTGQLHIITLNNEDAPEGLPPVHTDLFAERSINAQGFKTGLEGEYLVDSVEQVFTQSGWSTTVECNGGKQGKVKASGLKPVVPLKIVDL